ncbi:PREDICTED: ufm1-specific protease 1 [Vollenhovia emeryi]|uniref:ufm1-specific protease 1 n=1 Tax=Vollenhovia emeryi TaxID=411798 RepID=UPI0005F38BFE|nr:PREDICTED: ufm1-specific protease 1 [Vollenhovia emeryi]XP_011874220.1 PREDICTED: ufm1-specific protease 1 [Vollenhovia emeryi]XP_011874221.1 PREDICTED: ufm1-specific protease 1 [Vollenhovia emeryi]XP_011874222.1 PREDICTED: ufm1-specific protease 1 [Vollenhovia emeryi]XP_011874223.1 PREDICTED: ufm1-specific protease 1 [Vollenhovia emeryi]
MAVDYSSNLLKNVHENLASPDSGETFLVRGHYEYWHYGCDGFDDRGWGCGYRTLQTICSWIINNDNLEKLVPSINEIQETLVATGDKDGTFVGSREWIGSFEVSIVVNQLYDVLSKIIHVPSGKGLVDQVDNIKRHLLYCGSPIMMGGDRDCSSKCIVGLHVGNENVYLLIVDPHLIGKAKSAERLMKDQWVKWQNLDDFVGSSFYNLCLPLLKYRGAVVK